MSDSEFFRNPTGQNAAHQQNTRMISCPSCDGKGHVVNVGVAAIYCLTIVFAPLVLLDADNKHGVTRKQCSRCNGTGRIVV